MAKKENCKHFCKDTFGHEHGLCCVDGQHYCENIADCDFKQLQTAKEENNRLRGLLGKPYKKRIDLENIKLTQQNKQIVKVLRYIKSITDFEQVKYLPEQRERCLYQFKLVNGECAEALEGVKEDNE